MDTSNTEKHEISKRNEPQSNNIRNTTRPNCTEQSLTQEVNVNIKILRRIMSGKKTRLSLLRNQDYKTVKAETEKTNEY